MADIRFENVKKIYPGGIIAVQDFSLDIKDGEFIVLVGPSGCGKSTVLRMIAGLEPISTGCLRIDGQIVNQIPAKDRDLAMVFQGFALYPHMTVYQNIAFPLVLRHVDRAQIDREVRQIAAAMQLTHLLNRKPRALSVGQRQRTALGRAMVRHPGVLLLDEPLSNLDAALRLQMRTELTQLHRTLGTTFLYVTHDQTEAVTLADRIVIMKNGMIQQADTPRGLYHFPQNRFVADFIGSPSMNFLPASLEHCGDDYIIRLFHLRLHLPDSPHANPLLPCYIGHPVTLGIRPEHLSCSRTEPDAVPLTVSVELCAPHGSDAYLHCHCHSCPLVVRVPPDFRPASQIQTIWLSLSHCHIFAPDSQQTLFSSAVSF